MEIRRGLDTKWIVIVVAFCTVLLGLAIWYWVVRPETARRECNEVGIKHMERFSGREAQLDAYYLNYNACLHKRGL
jgi:hypothetical protein